MTGNSTGTIPRSAQYKGDNNSSHLPERPGSDLTSAFASTWVSACACSKVVSGFRRPMI